MKNISEAFRVMVFMALCAAVVTPLGAAVLYVDGDAPAGGNGANWATAYKYLEDALPIANSGDEIWVAEGVYHPDKGTGSRYSSFVIPRDVSLFGGFSGVETDVSQRRPGKYVTVLSGDFNGDDNFDYPSMLLHYISENAFTVVTLYNVTNVTISGFTITGGNSDNSTNIEYSAGGGIYIENSSVVIDNCKIIRNAAFMGGGIYSMNAQSLQVHSSLICENNALNGSPARGGGVYLIGSGGAHSFNFCTFANNYSEAYNGAIREFIQNDIIINNSIFYNNYALNNIGEYILSDSNGNFIIDSSVIDVGLGDPKYFDGNVQFSNCLGSMFPEMVDPDNGNYRLKYTSPCIDFCGSGILDVDVDLNPLLDLPSKSNMGMGLYTYADAGAYEFQGFSISGRIVGDFIHGMIVNASGSMSSSSALTDVNGLYSATRLDEGNYFVTPSCNGYVFTPASTTITLTSTGGDVTGINFTAVRVYTLSSTVVGGNGQVSPSGSVQVPAGNDFNFQFFPDTDYRVADVKVDNVSVGAADSYTFKAVTADHDLEVSFEENKFTISGQVALAGDMTDPQGVILYLLDSFGQPIDSVTLGTNGDYSFYELPGTYSYSLNQPPYDFTVTLPSPNRITVSSGGVTQNVNATVVDTGKFLISAVVNGGGGSLSPSGDVWVDAGNDIGFDVLPEPMMGVLNLFVDGTQVGPTLSYTFFNVQANHDIVAEFYYFEEIPVNIQVSVSGLGNVIPDGTVYCLVGSDRLFNFTPIFGYRVQEVYVNSMPKGAITSYEFKNISSDNTLHVVFEEIPTYSISGYVTSDGNGLEDATVDIVMGGGGLSTTVTSSDGYYIFEGLYNQQWYTLTTSRKGYVSVTGTQNVFLDGADMSNINFACRQLRVIAPGFYSGGCGISTAARFGNASIMPVAAAFLLLFSTVARRRRKRRVSGK